MDCEKTVTVVKSFKECVILMCFMGLKMKCCLKNVEVWTRAMVRMILEDCVTSEISYCITILLSNYLWISVLDWGGGGAL
jgi:hypothetical protein